MSMVFVVCWWMYGHMMGNRGFLKNRYFNLLVNGILLVDWYFDLIRNWLLYGVWDLLLNDIRLGNYSNNWDLLADIAGIKLLFRYLTWYFDLYWVWFFNFDFIRLVDWVFNFIWNLETLI